MGERTDVSRVRRIRRLAAFAVALAGVLDVASAVTPPLGDRLHLLVRLVPLAVPQVATALVAGAGVSLLLLGRGVRGGQRDAWRLCIALLVGTALLHLVKGGDVEETIAAALLAVWLVRERDSFRASSDRARLWHRLSRVVLGGAAAVLGGVLSVEIFRGRRPVLPIGEVFVAVLERLIGIAEPGLPPRVDRFVSPALAGVGLALLLGLAWALFSPASRAADAADLDRAAAFVAEHGDDTLAYFALRRDKDHFFHGETVVAYGLRNGVCLVTPDPVGPASERAAAWAAFREFADRNGWHVAVLGASEHWLPLYRETGMNDLYIGDEAVVDCTSFSMAGGDFKGLRQAVNRIAKYGYTIEFHDPAKVDTELKRELHALMAESRQGEAERGFSMTLGRIFDPSDEGLLLAVASDAERRAVAFCHYVPATGINGYSLDMMRRSRGEHPNGLTDFVVVRTIEHLRELGMRGLGLNFATMRAVLAGEAGQGIGHRGQRWLLRRLSKSMQIESLWRYNAKFAPEWHPRYAAYDSVGMLVPAALAVARAESFWELPLIGRLFRPS
jgi:lysylphosphatidylglycerol synthetase-like protein (DUF2156 family)